MTLLRTESLTCRRGRHVALRGVNLAAGAGECLLVTGPNGCGKSTLLRALAGLVPAAEGVVSWDGAAIAGDIEAHQARLRYVGHLDAVKGELTAAEMVGYWEMIQSGERWNSSPLEGEVGWGGVTLGDKVAVGTFAAGLCHAPPSNSPLKGGRTGAVPVANDGVKTTFGIEPFLTRPIRLLSAGQRRRLALTRLLIGDAPLWLLDEPTTALDGAGQGLLLDAIARHRAGGGIAVVATHDKLPIPDAREMKL